MRVTVVGGGFRGIVAALDAAKQGCEVTLVERLRFLGTFLHSTEWDGLFLDHGCHLFDNSDDETTALFMEILDGQIRPVNTKYASILRGRWSEGIAVPDLTVLGGDGTARMLLEVLEQISGPDTAAEPASLAESLAARYGGTAAAILGDVAMKVLRLAPDRLDPAAARTAPLSRVRIVPDAIGAVLKKLPALDERLAVSSANDPMRFYRHRATRYPYRSFYPATGGMRTFCDKALSELQTRGVDVRLGAEIARVELGSRHPEVELKDGTRFVADLLIWCAHVSVLEKLALQTSTLRTVHTDMPLVLYYFRLPAERVADYTYIHDFSPGTLTYRWSAPGVYGGQFWTDGTTYVCFEVPTSVDSAVYSEPSAYVAAVWSEGLASNVVSGPLPERHRTIALPTSYKIARRGFSAALRDVTRRVQQRSERVVIADPTSYTKVGIVQSLRSALQT